jgi:hypothetical protein
MTAVVIILVLVFLILVKAEPALIVFLVLFAGIIFGGLTYGFEKSSDPFEPPWGYDLEGLYFVFALVAGLLVMAVVIGFVRRKNMGGGLSGIGAGGYSSGGSDWSSSSSSSFSSSSSSSSSFSSSSSSDNSYSGGGGSTGGGGAGDSW